MEDDPFFEKHPQKIDRAFEKRVEIMAAEMDLDLKYFSGRCDKPMEMNRYRKELAEARKTIGF